MAALEDPEVDVKPITDEQTFRVKVEAAAVLFKFDLHDMDVMQLATECVAALIAQAASHENCPFCGPGAGLDEDETCELVALYDLIGQHLRRGGHEHKRGDR